MKKIYTLAALLLATSTATFAQKTIDLQVDLISPTNGTSTVAGNDFQVKVVFKNGGPAAIAPTDSLIWTDDGTSLYYITGKTKAVNDTIQLNFPFTTSASQANGTNYQYCIDAFMLNRVAGVNTITEGDTSNNYECATGLIITGSTGFSTLPLTKANSYKNGVEILTTSPNPAVAEINLNYTANSSNNVVARVTDIAGRVVMTQDFGASFNGKNNFKLNMSELTNGIYFIELTEGGRRSIGKMIKQ